MDFLPRFYTFKDAEKAAEIRRRDGDAALNTSDFDRIPPNVSAVERRGLERSMRQEKGERMKDERACTFFQP